VRGVRHEDPGHGLEAVYHSQLSNFLFSDREIAAFLEIQITKRLSSKR